MKLGKIRRMRSLFLAVVIAALMGITALFVLPVAAEDTFWGNFTVLGPSGSQALVEVSGDNDGVTVITLSDTSANFGTINPLASFSESDDVVEGLQGEKVEEGSYYAWKSAAGKGLIVTVKSNRSWDGAVRATENQGTSSTLTVASGSLRYMEGSEPTGYDDCANAQAFSTSDNLWRESEPQGVSTFVHYYCLRSDWYDEPGTFLSNVIYTVTQ
jgi:hypothetical protein